MTSAGAPGELPASLARFERQKTILLETRKRDGSWVATPVSLAVDAGRAYFRTYHTAGKHKRLRNFSDVRVAPCTVRGTATGPAVAATARLLGGDEAEHARSVLARRYRVMHGLIVPFMHRRKGWQTVHYELTLVG
jgi:PPOX class probable F420-dependent enzyme